MMIPLPRRKYGAILADPPWRFRSRSEKGDGRSAKQHYDVMDLEAIKALPVRELAAPDCALFLWVTDTHLRQGLEVMEAWGFTFKTVGFYWAKTNRDDSFFTGMGYWTRANPEQCLLGTIGSPKRLAKNVARLVVSPRREHSRKPEEISLGIERLVGGPYLEMFARTQRVGWDSWGNQVDRFPTADNDDDSAGAYLRALGHVA